MKNIEKIKKDLRSKRHGRTRVKINGTEKRPRISVFKSLKHISVQLIDDQNGRTLVSASDLELKATQKKETKEKTSGANDLKAKIGLAYAVGELAAKKAVAKDIKEAVFDKSGFKYHGRIKAVADGARSGGLKF
jgi:large subunit ribosomal protein L18